MSQLVAALKQALFMVWLLLVFSPIGPMIVLTLIHNLVVRMSDDFSGSLLLASMILQMLFLLVYGQRNTDTDDDSK